MPSPRTASKTLDRIEAVAGRAAGAAELRAALLDVLRPAIGFDGYVWLLTDPVTTVGAAPLADLPGIAPAELPGLIRARYTSGVSRWTVLTQQPDPVALLDCAGVDHPGASGTGRSAWEQLLARYGIGAVASTVFADAYGCWGFLDLWRGVARAPFDEADAALLAGAAPSVTAALRRCQARTFVAPARPHRSDFAPVVLTLDDDLRIVGRTAASQDWLDRLLPPAPGVDAVPASVFNVAAQLLAAEAGVDDHPASSRTHLGDGFWLTLRAARMASADGTDPIVVSIEETSAVERVELFTRAHGLSAREHELFGLLATGADTRAMARLMGLSEHTVQDHLKSIFAKTGARDRVTLLSRALGTGLTPAP